ncbi:MAG: tetratricopeptide repeat protein, partial [Actinocrinis sp.]
AFRRVLDFDHQDYAPQAAFRLGLLLEKKENLADAEQVYRQAVDSRHRKVWPGAAINLALLLKHRGELAGARDLYRLATECDDPALAASAGLQLSIVLVQMGDVDGARAAFDQAKGGGKPALVRSAGASLGIALVSAGRQAEALPLLREGADAVDTGVLIPLADALAREGRWTEAEPFFRRAVEAQVPGAGAYLGELLVRLGHVQEAEVHLRREADQGDMRAMVDLAVLLIKRGSATRDASLFGALGLGTPDYREVVLLIGGPLTQLMSGDRPTEQLVEQISPLAPSEGLREAERILRRAVGAGHRGARRILAALLAATGRLDDAEAVARESVDGGDESALGILAALLMRQDAGALSGRGPHARQVRELAQQWAQTGNTDAVMFAAMLDLAQGRDREALERFGRAAAAGNVAARALSLIGLAGFGLIDEAHAQLLDIVARADERDYSALEAFLSTGSTGPTDPSVIALRRLHETRDPADARAFLATLTD